MFSAFGAWKSYFYDAETNITPERESDTSNDDIGDDNDDTDNSYDASARIVGKETKIFDFYMYAMEDEKYYLSVTSNNMLLSAYNYKIRLISPDYEDIYEPNNRYAEATDLNNLISPLNDATLALDSRDYYKFTTGSTGAMGSFNLSADPECQKLKIKNMRIADSDNVLDVSQNAVNNAVSINDLELAPNTTYYITIMQSQNNTCPGHPYVLSWNIVPNPSYSAVLNIDTPITVPVGVTDYNISSMLLQIAENMTFSTDGENVPSTEAVNNLSLYYMNGEEKTLLPKVYLKTYRQEHIHSLQSITALPQPAQV